MLFLHPRQQLQPAHAIHTHVADNDIGGLGRYLAQQGFTTFEHRAIMALFADSAFQHPADRTVVINHPDSLGLTHLLSPREDGR